MVSQFVCSARQLVSLLDPAIHVSGEGGHCQSVHDGICDLSEEREMVAHNRPS